MHHAFAFSSYAIQFSFCIGHKDPHQPAHPSKFFFCHPALYLLILTPALWLDRQCSYFTHSQFASREHLARLVNLAAEGTAFVDCGAALYELQRQSGAAVFRGRDHRGSDDLGPAAGGLVVA
jgi:hypothetical protein